MAETMISLRRIVALVALARVGPLIVAAARVRLKAMTARMSQAAFAVNTPEGRCARALFLRSALTCSWLCRRRHKHDLRHSFAVNTLLDAYRSGGDVGGRIPLLSTYLGHTEPANTYWYLQAAPELLALAADRLNTRDGQDQR